MQINMPLIYFYHLKYLKLISDYFDVERNWKSQHGRNRNLSHVQEHLYLDLKF